jgi:Na+:H+ antiporter, NhaA family
MIFTKHFKSFFKHESASGVILIIITIFTMITVNFILQDRYLGFWKTDFLGKPLDFWVNDVLMTFFFLLVGFEIEREVYVGELANLKQALLPIIAAIGGMIVPALIYISFNYTSGSISGFGIPMATDIAFSLTILAILTSRIPSSLKVFLTALAIIDDLGAIIIIAIFYTKSFSFLYLVFAILLFLLMVLFNRKKLFNLLFYFIPGIAMWICIYKSGIHPTIAGVLLALVIPFGKGDEKSPSYKLQLKLHTPVAYFILPVFAIVNTGILLTASDFKFLLSTGSLGIVFGLIIGKPLGIFLFSWLGVKTKICYLFENLKWKHIIGAGIIAGIGFTMSMFIGLLAFNNPLDIKISKLSILIASFIAAVLGFLFIRFSNKLKTKAEIEFEENN